MINLLSPGSQKQYRAARLNLRLRNYLIVFSCVTLAIAGTFGAGVYLTTQERTAAEKQYQEREQSLAAYSSVKSEAESFADNLKTAKSILSQEVRYSDMVTRIASTLPPDAVLGSLTLDQATISKPVAFNARVKTKDGAISLKTTLEASPLFENVNINNIIEEKIESTEKNTIKRDFPVVVTISLTFSKGQPGSLIP